MDRILGQNRAIELLQSALSAERVHHAYIFHGPEGVGKFTTALIFARVLLCHDAAADRAGRIAACGDCPSCQQLRDPNGSAHPDLHIVTKELARYSEYKEIRERKLTTIPVEVMRSTLIEAVYRASQLRHNKVFVVDEAELLAPIGQNALLKTLEEPPEGTYLILVTSRETELLPTVRSRCQRIPFVPLSDQVVADWLKSHASDLPPAQQDWTISFAAGSLGRAQLAVDYQLDAWARDVLPAIDAMCAKRYPTDLGAQMASHIDDFAKRWVDGHDNASKEAANRQGTALMCSMISRHAQQQIETLAARCSADDLEGTEAALEPWLDMIDALRTTEALVNSNVNLGLVNDHLVSLLYRTLTRQAVSA